MARISKEEQKAKHLSELNVARVKKYYENHPIRHFDVVLDIERYEKINTALKEQGITKKQFLEDAIDRFLKGQG